MSYQEARIIAQPQNPFEGKPKNEYFNLSGRLFMKHVYGSDDLNPIVIKRDIEEIRKQILADSSEEELKGLKMLENLLMGLEAHERANNIFYGEWQVALSKTANIMSLTQEQVQKLFEAMPLKRYLLHAEDRAIEFYKKLLDLDGQIEIPISDRFVIDENSLKTDVAIMLIDLLAIKANRIKDPEKRNFELENLRVQSAKAMDSLGVEDFGKKFELMEINLLRTLIEQAGYGHLATVAHGTMREDLNPRKKSVDMRLAVGGNVYNYQIKNLGNKQSADERARNAVIIDLASRKLRDTSTKVIRLVPGDVEHAYYTMEAQIKAGNKISKRNKLVTFDPLIEQENGESREKLLVALGLSKEDLEDEDRELLEKQRNRESLELEMRKKQQDAEIRARDLVEELNNLTTYENAGEKGQDQGQGQVRHEQDISESRQTSIARTTEIARRNAEILQQQQDHLQEVAKRDLQQQVKNSERKAAEAIKKENSEKRSKDLEKARPWKFPDYLKEVNLNAMIRFGLMEENERLNIPKYKGLKDAFLKQFGINQPKNDFYKIFKNLDEFMQPSDELKSKIASIKSIADVLKKFRQ